jgi:glycosyltransferase involved in cell wall biosynthesis
MEKVLFLINAREFGGLEIVLLDWLSRVDYSNVSVVLGTRGDALAERLAANGLAVENIKLTVSADEPFWKAFPRWLRVLSSIRPARTVFLEGNIGEFNMMAVLAAWWSTRGNAFLFAGGWGCAPASKPVSSAKRILHYGFLPEVGLYRYKEILEQRFRGRLLRRTFVASQALKGNLLDHFGYPASRTSVLYHGVDTRRFQPSMSERIAYRRAQCIPDHATVIVSHGRLAPVKRVDRILKAFEVLSAEDTNLWLLMTAYGTYKEEVEKQVASTTAHRRIKLIGFHQDASKILKAADIYVLASDNEGFGVALVEAMSTGLVCVATNCQGPAEIIVNGENGILVRTADEEVLIGLRRALGLSQQERARLVEQARKTVESRFEIHAAVRRALDSMKIASRS